MNTPISLHFLFDTVDNSRPCLNEDEVCASGGRLMFNMLFTAGRESQEYAAYTGRTLHISHTPNIILEKSFIRACCPGIFPGHLILFRKP